MKLRKRNDSANTQVLETVVIASIMVSAVAFVATFETPPNGSAPTRDLLQKQAEDALKILYDTPVPESSFGTNALSAYVAECLQNECDNLSARLDRLLPSGASYALYVSNGHATYPILITKEPSGEAVTAKHLMEPRWSQSFVATGSDMVNPTSDPLILYTLPIFSSNPIQPGGNPLKVFVHAVDQSTGANYTLTGYTSTQAYDLTDRSRAQAVSLYFVDAAGAPLPMLDVRDTLELLGDGTKATTLTLRMTESAGVAVPEGVNLTVSLPRGWTGHANHAANAAHWTIVTNATDKTGRDTGGDIQARLTHAVSNDTVDFTFTAAYHGDVLEYYPIHAQLSRGALSTATILLEADSHAQGAFDYPTVYTSVPRPMGADATTTWTLAALSPKRDGAMQDTYIVNRIEIVEQDGLPIFADVQARTSNQFGLGQWTSLGDRLVWTGFAAFSSNSPLNMSFDVTASGVGSPADNRAPIVPPITFESGTGRFLGQSAPGFFRSAFLPADDAYVGYLSDSALGESERVWSNLTYRTTSLPGSVSVSSGLTNPARDALFGSYVNVETRDVPVGGQVVLTTNVQSVLFALAEAGHSAGVKVNFYPPWSGDNRDPIYSDTSLDAGIARSSVVEILLHDLNGDTFPDPIVGTSNGRVFALHALTGARFQGDVYSAPLRENLNVTSAAGIKKMDLMQIDGESFIVVGTDALSTGLIVLDTDFAPVWTYDFKARDVLALDTRTDVTGDGRADIVVAVELHDASAIFVFSRNATTGTFEPVVPPIHVSEVVSAIDGVPIVAEQDVSAVDEAFAVVSGSAAALVAMDSIGQEHDGGGFAVTLQTIFDVDVTVDFDPANPGAPIRPVYSTPRVGLQGVNSTGSNTYTFFGTPVTAGSTYDFDGAGATDMLVGGPAGYVLMLNGTQATQPIYSLVLVGGEAIVAADSPTPLESYVLTGDDYAYYTDDGWASFYCLNCDPVTEMAFPVPNAKALSSNATGSLWIAGSFNTLYRTVVSEATMSTSEQELKAKAYLAESPIGKKNAMLQPVLAKNLPAVKYSASTLSLQTYELDDAIYDFRDTHFYRDARGDQGWVVGARCEALSELLTIQTEIENAINEGRTPNVDEGMLNCHQPFLMRTTNGGGEWRIASEDDPESSLVALDGGAVRGALNGVRFHTGANGSETGFAFGDGGVVLRSTDGGVSWHGIASPTTSKLLDMACLPGTSLACVVVGENGTAYRTGNALAAAADVAWTELGVAATMGERKLTSVGFHDAETGYIGTTNAVLKTYDGGMTWTTLPLNYLENDAYAVNAFPDGTGYVYGGSHVNGRIWFLADYATSGVARTKVLTPELPEGAQIRQVETIRSNLTMNPGATDLTIWAKTAEENWAPFVVSTTNTGSRNVSFAPTPFDGGRDLVLEFQLGVKGDKTLFTPAIRHLDLLVTYEHEGENKTLPVSVDFGSEAQLDHANTTAWWNAPIGTLHQSVVQEHWVRNVSGEVLSIRHGYDATGDGRDDAWVSTGGVIALNSPDYNIYAGTDKTRVIDPDNRVYLLDGTNGTILATSASLPGRVVDIELSDVNGDGTPEYVYAGTHDLATGTGTIHCLDARTLESCGGWTSGLGGLNDVEVGLVHGSPYVFGATQAYDQDAVRRGGMVVAYNASADRGAWQALPDDRGHYVVTADVPENWFFGPYVVEVEVSWEEAVSGEDPILRSARVYDYFMVTPPSSLSPPSAIYDVHLVAWYDDWR